LPVLNVEDLEYSFCLIFGTQTYKRMNYIEGLMNTLD